MRIIPKITHYDQFDGKLATYGSNISFAVFEPENNYYNAQEMAEIYAAVLGGRIDNELVLELIAFRPKRILEQEIIIALTLEVQLHDLDEDLAEKFELVKDAIDVDGFVAYGDSVRRKNLEIAKASDNSDIQLLESYVAGKYVAGITEGNIRSLINANQMTTPILRELARSVVEEALDSLIQEGKLEALTEYDLADRITFTVSGAIASGKGNLEKLMKEHVKVLGISWKDIMKINGDSYKPLLNSAYKHEISKQKMMLSSQLCQDDITFIGMEINRRLLEKVQSIEKAPNAYLDKSFLNERALEIALSGKGRVCGFMASLPVEEAMARSEARGKSTGRFEDTYQILEAHSNIAKKFIDLLIKYKDQNIAYTVFDNDVAKGTMPVKVAEVELKAAKILIYDYTRFMRFLDKSELDVRQPLADGRITYNNNASSRDYMYQIVSFSYELFTILRSCAA